MEQAPAPTLETLSERFTIDGSAELESLLQGISAKLRDRLLERLPKNKMQLLLLGGGYGRGEGGVLRTWEGDKPYNDLEFYLFLDGPILINQKIYGPHVHHIAEELTTTARIEVEVKILSIEKLERSPVTMFFYDLLAGHKVIYGEEKLLHNSRHHLVPSRIPLYEATRLLMNRCSGLLFSAERLRRKNFGNAEADFVFRNISKAKLALGDVLLTARGEYHWSCRERNQRLQALEIELPFSLQKVVQMHTEGVEFKLHPVASNATREALKQEHAEITLVAEKLWLWLESLRLQENFPTPQAYGLSPARKCPETLKLKNMIINAREFGPGTILDPSAGYYPRERLLHSLPLLLWVPDFNSRPDLLNRVQHQVRSNSSDFHHLVAAYETIWRKFN